MMFHGNGGNLGHRIPLGKVFFSKMRCNVVMMEYRGYGNSEGTPSEAGKFLKHMSSLTECMLKIDQASALTPRRISTM
jgi:hypothetical protein